MKPETRFTIIEMGLMYVVCMHLDATWVILVLMALVITAWHVGYTDGKALVEGYKQMADEAIDTLAKANDTNRKLVEHLNDVLDETEKKE